MTDLQAQDPPAYTGGHPRDPYNAARRIERPLWQASPLLDEAHIRAIDPDRSLATVDELADRLRALAEIAVRIRVLAVDTGAGDRREGELARLVDAAVAARVDTGRADPVCAEAGLEVAALLTDQAARGLGLVAELLDGACRSLTVASLLPSGPSDPGLVHQGAEQLVPAAGALEALESLELAGDEARRRRVALLTGSPFPA